MDFFDVVTTQRTMRRLKTDAIADDALKKIMDAAICAPSGGNRQNWSFVVVRDQAKRARLGEQVEIQAKQDDVAKHEDINDINVDRKNVSGRAA